LVSAKDEAKQCALRHFKHKDIQLNPIHSLYCYKPIIYLHPAE